MNREIVFLLTIDTEEEGLWGGKFHRHPQCTVENIRQLPAFQEFCQHLEIRPTYLIDYPVIINDFSADIIRSLAQTGDCEIGAHLHPWCNPPYEEEITIPNTYTNNLPNKLQLNKLEVLTNIITEIIGVTPKSYRAGRYGFDESTVPVLEQLGYTIDTSIVPLRNNHRSEEPVFGMVELNPYFLNEHNIETHGNSRILEIPLTVDFTRPIPSIVKKWYPNFPDIGIRRVLRKIWGIDLVWLRPSYATLEEMQALADTVIGQGVRVLNMMFHSSELLPGASPYNKTRKDVEQFLKKVAELMQYLQNRYTIIPMTLQQCADKFISGVNISSGKISNHTLTGSKTV